MRFRKSLSSLLLWALRTATAVGILLALSVHFAPAPYDELIAFVSALLLIPGIVTIIQMFSMPLRFTWLGGVTPPGAPSSETAICVTPRLSLALRQAVGVGTLWVSALPFAVFSSVGIRLVLYPSGIVVKTGFREVMIPHNQISKIDQLSSIPRVYAIYHRSSAIRSPLGFTDQVFYEAIRRQVPSENESAI